jgi:phage shock protein A
MSLENRVSQVEAGMNDVRALLSSAARHAESATAIAEQNATAISDQRQDLALIGERLAQHIANSEVTRQQLAQNSQRLDEFVYQAQRLLSNQGDRLARMESALESLVTLSQSHERRLTGRESKLLEAEDRLDRIEANLESLSSDVRSLTAAVDRLETILERHLSNHS